MPINSRTKGKVAELEIAHLLTKAGYPSYRAAQRTGKHGDCDVVCRALPNFAIEVKRRRSINDLWRWLMRQGDDAPGRWPLVFTRRNHEGWVVSMRLEDFLLAIKGCTVAQKDPEEIKASSVP